MVPTEKIESILVTAGGKICCRRCNAMSKRTKEQCGAPAISGKTKCKSHGGLSTGPRTPEGRMRCAQAKTIHGYDTRAIREQYRESMERIKFYAALLGISWQGKRIWVGRPNKA
jgi:hypothetical protein